MKELWNQTLEHLKGEIPPHAFNTWFKPLHFVSVEDHLVNLEVPNGWYRDRLSATYGDLIRSSLRTVAQDDGMEVSFVVPEGRSLNSPSLRDVAVVARQATKASRDASDGINARYTFESFVIGAGNQFAHAASMAVAEAPGQAYNPLFLYGGVGLGKTHLLSAIGNLVASLNPGSRVVYRGAERFMNELINAIRFEKTAEFRTYYRQNCDVLLMDDVQFLGGKERTQEEFFHTFNTLYEGGRQIVITSDQYPKDIPGLDERLRSRFEWGLLADIQPPDIETRVAILRKKAENHRVSLPDDVALFLATQIKSNVRVLEGALTRLAAFASISRRPITLDLTRDIFGSLAPENRKLTVDMIQKRVAEFFSLNVADLRSSRRHKVVTLPRQVAMYLSRKLTSSSFPEIGNHFGGKDHTTVIHAVSKIEGLLAQDSPFKKTVAAIEQGLQADT